MDRLRINPTSLVQLSARALCVFALLSLPACRPWFQREVSSAVLAVEGPAFEIFAGKRIALKPNEWLLPGTRIATREGGRLDLMLLPGILVELEGDTEIEITHLRFARDGDENIRPMRAREASIRLLRGTLFAAVGQSQTRSRLFIETPVGNFTAFDLRTFKIDISRVRIEAVSVRGRVNFKPAGGGAPVKFDAGQFIDWPTRELAPQIVAESGPEVQAQVPQILRAEKRLIGLQKQFGTGFVPWREQSEK